MVTWKGRKLASFMYRVTSGLRGHSDARYSLKWPLNTLLSALRCITVFYCISHRCKEQSSLFISCCAWIPEFLLRTNASLWLTQSSCSESLSWVTVKQEKFFPPVTQTSCRSQVIRVHQSRERSCHLRVQLHTLCLYLRERETENFFFFLNTHNTHRFPPN